MSFNHLLSLLLSAALAADICCASSPEHQAPAVLPSPIDEPPVNTAPIPATARSSIPGAPGTRGPIGQILFDSISGCTTLRSYGSGPTAILDDFSFFPGPAATAGAVVSGMDFYIRTWGPRERITVRLSFYNRINPDGEGEPALVQHDLVTQQFLVIENTSVNLASPPGSYLISTSLTPFVLHAPEFALEIAYVDDDGEILTNGPLSTVFPGNPCVLIQPVIGSSQEVFWIDNDSGNLSGDGIRYEPADPSTPGDQGDALMWGGATPADNVLAIRLRGYPVEPSLGACCLTVEPFACFLETAAGCAALGRTFIGLGEPCSPVFLCVPPPPNDLCEQASIIDGTGVFEFDTRGASSNGPDDCRLNLPPFGISSDVWFNWTAPCTGSFAISTCAGSVTDDRLAVYAGTCAQTALIQCDDDSCESGFQSLITLPAVAGEAYLIRLGAYPNTPGGQGGLSLTFLGEPCPGQCAADFDGNGTPDVADIFAFLSAWFAQDPRAWFFGGSEGGVPSIFAFLGVWFAGC